MRRSRLRLRALAWGLTVGLAGTLLSSAAASQPRPPPADRPDGAEPAAPEEPAPEPPAPGPPQAADATPAANPPEPGDDSGDVSEPWAPPSAPGSNGEPAARHPPDWGLSGEDVVSPWKGSSGPRPPLDGRVEDTVSPWDGRTEVPPEVAARFDVRLGDRDSRRAPREALVRHGVFDRPYLLRLGNDASAVAIGGYLDMLASYMREEGVSDGFEFEARRFNLFIASRIADAVRMSSEIAFLPSERSVALENAFVDLLFHPSLNLRAGILLAPIGKFNLAHDAPIYDVIDRPLVATEILPSTLSEVGGGLFGAFYPGGGHRLTYAVYLVGGLQDGLVSAEGTRLREGRRPEMFAGDNNGSPALASRVAFVSKGGVFTQAELGFSAYAGVYNRPSIDGLRVDDPRWLRVLALDGELSLGPWMVRGEGAYAIVDLPDSLGPLFARRQAGLYVESSLRFFQRKLGVFERASLAAVVRADWIDLNTNRLVGSDDTVGEETVRITVGPSFRPAPETALRLLYQHNWIEDAFNHARRGGGVQLGIASYF